MTDDPKQIDALDKLKINVGPAQPGRLYGETPGAVGGGSAPSAPAAARPAGVGPDWTQGTVKGKPAWISPDKKQAVFS